ncbi:MAG: PA14 domain-containing protein [Anaerolineae bacterium]
MGAIHRLRGALASLVIVVVLATSLTVAVPVAAQSNETGWRGEYFANPFLAGQPAMVRTDPAIDFIWGTAGPVAGFPGDHFSVRWTRTLVLPEGRYRFTTYTDDGVRLWVDGTLLIDQWRDMAPTSFSAEVDLPEGPHTVRMEYYEASGGAVARLSWTRVGPTDRSDRVVEWPKAGLPEAKPLPMPALPPSGPSGQPPATRTPEDTWPSGFGDPEGLGAWRGEYYKNPWLSGRPALVREDARIDFNWGTGSPDPRLPADRFSVRWTRSLRFQAGTYRFITETDDGVRLYVDGRLVLNQWRDQAPTRHWADVDLTAGLHEVIMEYYENEGGAVARLKVGRLPSPPGPITAWRGEYYNNTTLSGLPALVRDDADVDFNWGLGSPAPGIRADNFSVRWTRDLRFQSGRYRFTVEADDGVRVWVDSALVIDEWTNGYKRLTRDIPLGEGTHSLRVEYYEAGGYARIRLTWELLPPLVGNLVTWVPPYPSYSWVKVYRWDGSNWVDTNPRGYASTSPSGYLKVDGLQVDWKYAGSGHPYWVELWINGQLARSVGNFQRGEREFRIYPYVDNYLSW